MIFAAGHWYLRWVVDPHKAARNHFSMSETFCENCACQLCKALWFSDHNSSVSMCAERRYIHCIFLSLLTWLQSAVGIVVMNSAFIKLWWITYKRILDIYIIYIYIMYLYIDIPCHVFCFWLFMENRQQAAEGATQLFPAAYMTDRNQQLERAVSGFSKEHTINNGFERGIRRVIIRIGVVWKLDQTWSDKSHYVSTQQEAHCAVYWEQHNVALLLCYLSVICGYVYFNN